MQSKSQLTHRIIQTMPLHSRSLLLVFFVVFLFFFFLFPPGKCYSLPDREILFPVHDYINNYERNNRIIITDDDATASACAI